MIHVITWFALAPCQVDPSPGALGFLASFVVVVVVILIIIIIIARQVKKKKKNTRTRFPAAVCTYIYGFSAPA